MNGADVFLVIQDIGRMIESENYQGAYEALMRDSKILDGISFKEFAGIYSDLKRGLYDGNLEALERHARRKLFGSDSV